MRDLENLKKWQREYYQKNKDNPEYQQMKKNNAKKSYLKNKDKILEKTKEYREKNKEKYNEYRREYRKYNANGIYSVIKEGLIKRNKTIDFLVITQNEFVEWYNSQEKKCHYCSRNIEEIKNSNDAFNKKIYRLTIDRKNNDIGYTKENICLCCYRCNSIKSDYFTEEEMLKIGKIIEDKNKCIQKKN